MPENLRSYASPLNKLLWNRFFRERVNNIIMCLKCVSFLPDVCLFAQSKKLIFSQTSDKKVLFIGLQGNTRCCIQIRECMSLSKAAITLYPIEWIPTYGIDHDAADAHRYMGRSMLICLSSLGCVCVRGGGGEGGHSKYY